MTTARTRYVGVTAQVDQTEHLVSDEANNAGMQAGGWFIPACGERFLAAAMNVAPRRGCPKCRQYARASASRRTCDERMNRPSWLSRLCRRRQPAGMDGEKTNHHDRVTPAGVQPSADAGVAPESKQGLSCPVARRYSSSPR